MRHREECGVAQASARARIYKRENSGFPFQYNWIPDGYTRTGREDSCTIQLTENSGGSSGGTFPKTKVTITISGTKSHGVWNIYDGSNQWVKGGAANLDGQCGSSTSTIEVELDTSAGYYIKWRTDGYIPEGCVNPYRQCSQSADEQKEDLNSSNISITAMPCKKNT